MHRRTRRTLIIVAAAVVLLAVAIFLRSKAPPEAARLLPESDGIIYINLKPFRVLLRHEHERIEPPKRVSDYQDFINATGIDWERDLDEAAIALHRMPNPNGPNGPVAYSMVMVGKITGPRLNNWLSAHAASRDVYAGHTIYKSIAGGDPAAGEAFLARLAEPIVFPKRLGRPEEFGHLVRSLIENDYMNAEVVRFDGGIRFQPK